MNDLLLIFLLKAAPSLIACERLVISIVGAHCSVDPSRACRLWRREFPVFPVFWIIPFSRAIMVSLGVSSDRLLAIRDGEISEWGCETGYDAWAAWGLIAYTFFNDAEYINDLQSWREKDSDEISFDFQNDFRIHSENVIDKLNLSSMLYECFKKEASVIQSVNLSLCNKMYKINIWVILWHEVIWFFLNISNIINIPILLEFYDIERLIHPQLDWVHHYWRCLQRYLSK